MHKLIKKGILALALVSVLGCGTDNKKTITAPTPVVTPTTIPMNPPLIPTRDVDDIYGELVPYTVSWRVESGKIYNEGKEVSFKGINWFGFETTTLSAHGLWVGRSVDSYMSQIKDLGFNALRLPLSPEVFDPNHTSSHGKRSPLENLKDVLWSAQNHKINVLLDLHNCSHHKNLSGSPINCGTQEDWFKTLEQIARISKEFSSVMGVDLFNEPHALSWKQWVAMSSDAGKRVLAINPRILIFVEGVANLDTDNAGYGAFWGENMVEAANLVPSIPLSRLVLAPHVYGPSVAWQGYFSDPSFPKNMESIWDAHFGYLTNKGYTLAIGEFGGRYVGKDKIWQDAFVDYLIKKDIKNFFYWSLNPNSGDTGGILYDDWKSVNWDKMNLIKRLY